MAAGQGNYQNSPPMIYNQGLFDESATQKHPLGTIRCLEDGRRFVYAQATAAALAAGIAVSKAVAPQDATVAAADVTFGGAVGSRTVSCTLTGTPTLNLYRDGLLCIKAGDGIGEMYKIRGNTADDDPASGRCTFFLYDALKTLWVAASTTIGLYANPYDGVLINPAVADGDATTGESVLGVTTRPVTASYYFWAQTWGLANVQLDIDAIAGAEADERVLVAGTTNGRLCVVAAGAENDQAQYGRILETADLTDAEASLVYLTIS